MPRPRKPVEVAAPVPPGPHVLEIRFNNKIVHMQRVHSYSVEQLDDRFIATGIMKLPVQQPVEESAGTLGASVVEPSA
jgi:hypothetical protein